MPLDAPLDGEAVGTGASSGVAVSGWFALAALGFTGVALLAGLGASMTWGDGGYWAVAIAVAGAVALAASLRWLGGGAAPVAGGMSVATDTLAGALVLAVPGAIFALGYDGLAYALGLCAGILLMQLVAAPRFAQSGAGSLPELITQRFPGRVVGVLSLAIITVSMTALLVAGLTAAGIVGMRLLGVDFVTATAAAACAALACFVVRGGHAQSTSNGLLFPLLLAALLVPLVILSAQWYGLPVPELAYSNSLWQLQGIEENLLEQELADPAFMRPMMTAFVSMSPVSFAGIVLGLATGIAVLPSLYSAPLARTSARNARHVALWGLGFTVLFLTLAPAAATYARQAIATLISDRIAFTQLPAWVFTYGKLGLVHACGHAATSAAAIAQACAALGDAGTSLRLQDLAVDPDVIALALPEIAGLNGMLMGLVAVAVLATVLATANAPLGGIVKSLGIGVDSGRGERLGSYAVAAVVLAASAVLASLRAASIIDIATWAAVIAAAGLFPVVICALWFRRANSWGAAAGMITGVGVLIGYLIAQRHFAVPLFETTAALSSGGASGLEYFTELQDAWAAADPGPAKDAAWAALDVHAQSVADWWGIRGLATVLLALPAGFLALVLVSLVTPAPRRMETAP